MTSGSGIEQRLVDAADQAISGRANVVHLTGGHGSGRTWHLDGFAGHAMGREMTVLRTAGHAADRTLVHGGLAALLRPVRDRLDTRSLAVLDPCVAMEAEAFDASAIRLAVFRSLTGLAASAPLAILLDDIDELDPESLDALSMLVRRMDADPIVVVTTGTGAAPWSSARLSTIRIEPMPDSALASMLVARGVSADVAAHLGESAAGNPGLAVALGDALTDEQRDGRLAVALLPRPQGALADDLLRQLQRHGDRVGRALAVASCEPSGDVFLVRAALELLAEDPSCLDDAEAAGVIDVVGPQLSFRDPWAALTAPHLVAPASRRAAHRALAACCSGPDQAAARAWHLAAAADGTNDDAADALVLLANNAAARGAWRSAVRSAERAATLARGPERRVDCLVMALGWALDAADGDTVERVAARLDGLGGDRDDARLALDEVRVFFDGPDAAPTTSGPEVPSAQAADWVARRDRRVAFSAAIGRGEHVVAAALLAESPADPLGDGLGAAHVERLRGDLRSSRARLASSAFASPPADGARRAWGHLLAVLLAADLDVLQGRGDDALDGLESTRWPASLSTTADRSRARARLQIDADASPTEHIAAFQHDDDGALGEMRDLVATGVLHRAAGDLRAAIEIGERSRLPIEVAEARMWLATVEKGDRAARDVAAGALHRCGVRGWDRRLDRVVAESETTVDVRPVDAAIGALSKAERRVAEAVASGMTNREAAAALIVSVKTVDFHLQQIYRKLEIRSRTELAVRMMNATTSSPSPRSSRSIDTVANDRSRS